MLKLSVFLRPYRGSVALVLALALAQSLASLYLPRLMADIVDYGIVPGDTRQIMIYGALMLLMALVGTACAVASSYFSSKTASGFSRDVRSRVFDRVAHLSVHQFDRFGTEGVTDLILVYGLYVLQACVARNFGTTLEENSLGYLPELQQFRDQQQR